MWPTVRSSRLSRLSTDGGESSENRYLCPERRLGALASDCVIDINRGFARYLQERGDRNPNEQAAERLPADLKSLMEGGAVALENAQRVIDHFAGIDCDNGGELSKVVHSRSPSFMLPGRSAALLASAERTARSATICRKTSMVRHRWDLASSPANWISRMSMSRHGSMRACVRLQYQRNGAPLARYWNSFPKTHLCAGRRDRRRNVRRHRCRSIAEIRRQTAARSVSQDRRCSRGLFAADRRIIERSRHSVDQNNGPLGLIIQFIPRSACTPITCTPINGTVLKALDARAID
jgi:hypothetical protein